MKRKLLALICAAVTLFSATACNSETVSSDITQISATSESSKTTTTTSAEITESPETNQPEATKAETTVSTSATKPTETSATAETTQTEPATTAATTAITSTPAATTQTTTAATVKTAATTTKATTTSATKAATTKATTVTTTTAEKPKPVEKPQEQFTRSTAEIVRDMGIGINLGNTYESFGDWIDRWGDGTPESYETAWGSPVITKKVFQGYADEGFGVVRIPVAWSNMMGSNYTVSPEYISAVRDAVDDALDCGLYVIINLHYDSGWLKELPTNKSECMKRYQRIWEQVADAFKDYGEALIFESQNEELGWDSVWNPWGGTSGKDESYALVNEVNQLFVDVIRASGGNNTKRHLLISGYQTDVGKTCDPLFEMPSDPAKRCAVSVHYYTPALFAILTEDADWGKSSYTWGTEAEKRELTDNMDKLYNTFVKNGIPVIIGEYGCPTENKDPDSVRLFISSVCEETYKREMCPVLWSTPGGHYDRDTCKIIDSKLRDLLNDITE